MKALYLISVWLHILAAMLWLGGMLYLVFVLVPVLRRQAYGGIAGRFLHEMGVQFRNLGWFCFALLLASGTFNLAYRGFGWADIWNGRLWQGPFGHAFAIKMILFALILVASALHDFWIGPKATAAMRQNPTAPETMRLRRQAGLFGRLNLLLGLFVVFMAVMMVRGWF